MDKPESGSCEYAFHPTGCACRWQKTTTTRNQAFPPALKPAERLVSIASNQITIRGVKLTDAEMDVLRGIAERMKGEPA
jgi:hypothetical protein